MIQTIIRIEGVEQNINKHGKTYWRTYALLDDGLECVGFGKDYDLGDKVTAFYHYGQAKMKHYHPPHRKTD